MEKKIETILEGYRNDLLDLEEAKKMIIKIIENENNEILYSVGDVLHDALPEECVRGWDEVKFCDVRQGGGNQCKLCSHYKRN